MKHGSELRVTAKPPVGGLGPSARLISRKTCFVVALQRVFQREVVSGYPPEMVSSADEGLYWIDSLLASATIVRGGRVAQATGTKAFS
jgi:hypothetical protein